MQEVTVVVQHEAGLHARPANLFVATAKKYASTITVTKNERQANAKSILNLMTLGAGMGTQITIRATGSDEVEAIRALQELVESNFGEPLDHPVAGEPPPPCH